MSISDSYTLFYAQISHERDEMMRLFGLFQQAANGFDTDRSLCGIHPFPVLFSLASFRMLSYLSLLYLKTAYLERSIMIEVSTRSIFCFGVSSRTLPRCVHNSEGYCQLSWNCRDNSA